jgi:hypothetical protein
MKERINRISKLQHLPLFKTICKMTKTSIIYAYSVALNQTRVNYASGEDYSGAE